MAGIVKIKFIKEGHGWIAIDKSFRHVSAFGKTKDEAKANLIEDLTAIASMLLTPKNQNEHPSPIR